MKPVEFDPIASARKHLIGGLVVAGIFGVGAVGYAATTELSGAVIAQGLLVVDSNVKKVQHPTGGVVGELRVRDGDRVKAGDILVRLDETQTRANLAIITKSLDEMAAREAREKAERDDAETVRFPDELVSRGDDPAVTEVLTGELKLFETRRVARNGQKNQLREEIRGIEVQREARVAQIEWIKKELVGINDLWEKNLIPYTRLTTLEREASRLDGERGQLISSAAQAQVKMLQVDQDMRAEVGKDLAEIRAKQSELVEKRIAAEDQLKRIDIRAPQDGVVHQSSVHTVGGVIGPAEQIMLVVPDADVLAVEAKIQPQDIDQVRPGQTAGLRFSAFNQRTTPELNGKVDIVSADVTQDQKTGATYYTVRISVPVNEVARLDGLKLVAGMPVETFIRTGERTVVSYLMRPLNDQVARAFKEK
jgi:HlyD family secretion protein